MSSCLETHQLTHHFSATEKVLDNISLRVPKGSIYGFLGPNGAGKTTTLRLVLGLLKTQQGEIKIFGQSFAQNRTAILSNIGSLIESPSLYAHLTARENLLILQKIYQCPVSRIDEVLEIVGLSDTGKKRAGRFSLGMKQRLSIAMALLHKPELLVLDEPTNGLDPNGIIEIRELLKRLNVEQNVTIIISSHLLAEIEKLVTHLGIINKGKLLFEGTMSELHSAQESSSQVVFETSDPVQALHVLSSLGIEGGRLDAARVLFPPQPKELVARMNAALVKEGIDVYEVGHLKNDLESIFIDLTRN